MTKNNRNITCKKTPYKFNIYIYIYSYYNYNNLIRCNFISFNNHTHTLVLQYNIIITLN